MISEFLQPEVQRWLTENANADVSRLAFGRNPFPQIPLPELLHQIDARQRARTKLPTWYATDGIVYPSKVSLEQTSSEETARFKAGLVSGGSIVDATGGFGIDSHFFSRHFHQVIHLERNPELSAIVTWNAKRLGAENIRCVAQDSSEFLENSDQIFDCIYVDPSRRHERKGRVFLLSDCEPDVPALLDLYFSKARTVLVKASPMLDISQAARELRCIRHIYVVAVHNEMRELLFLLEDGHTGDARLHTLNIGAQQQPLDWEMSVEPARESVPLEFLYEPDAAIRKAGLFQETAWRYDLGKLHRNSHLYTSKTLVADFPGRIFRIEKVISYDKSAMKETLQGTQANVTSRNFPHTPEELRKKWKIRDGGDRYAFFTTTGNNDKIVLLCAKIKTA